MLEEYLSVDWRRVHEEVSGLGGQHASHHSRHADGVHPADRSLHIYDSYIFLVKFLGTRVYIF